MFEGLKLRHAFSVSGGQKPPPQEPEEPHGLLDSLKAFAVARKGPALCQRLKDAFEDLSAKNTVDGHAKDVQTHFLLKAMGEHVEQLRENIMKGGAGGYEKMKEAGQYLSRIQKQGLEA